MIKDQQLLHLRPAGLKLGIEPVDPFKQRAHINPMKLAIDARVYDTQIAILVAKIAKNGAGKLRSTVEKLYHSRNDNWFLHGKGGALTEYAQHSANSISSGERITAITED